MTNSSNLTLDIQLTQKQFSYLTALHQKKSLIFSFFFYVLLFFTVVMSRNDFQFETAMVVVGLVGGIIVSSLILLAMYFLAKYQSFRQFNSDKLLQQKQTYEFSASGITAISDSGTAKILWNEIFKVAESKYIIALYAGRNRALILPKETIDQQMNQGTAQLKALIRENVPDNKVKLAS